MLKILTILLLLSQVVFALDQNNACTNYSNNAQDGSCSVSITMISDKSFYNNSEKIVFYNNLTSKYFPYVIEYWIESENGTILKSRLNTTNTDAKSYTPRLSKPGNLILKNRLLFVDCNNTSSFTSSEKTVFVNVDVSHIANITISSFNIGTDKKAKLGDILRPTASVYTGILGNGSIKVEIVNITSVFNLSVYGNYEYYDFKPEIEIPSDCNISTGNYTLKATFLDLISTKDFVIENDCKFNSTFIDSSPDNLTMNDVLEGPPESNINLSQSSNSWVEVYNSANTRAKKLMIYAFVGVVLFMLLILFKNNIISKNGIYSKSDNRSDRSS